MPNGPIDKAVLEDLYISQKLSVAEIARHLSVTDHKVWWWMEKHGIPRRSRSEASYIKHNGAGDPFSIKDIRTVADAQLLGIGIGLYWGEGNKANRYSVRLGNTDPQLIKMFIRFLVEICGVRKSDMRFGLQIFSDIDPQQALAFWMKKLSVEDSQFYKVTVTISGSIGTYRHKCEYGVLTVYYHNKKLRDILINMLP